MKNKFLPLCALMALCAAITGAATSARAEGEVKEGPVTSTGPAFSVSGRLQTQYVYVTNKVKSASGQKAKDPKDTAGFEVRRATINFEAKINEQWSALLAGELSGGSWATDTAAVYWKPMPEFGAWAGYDSACVGREWSTSGSKLLTVEKSAVSSYFGGQLKMLGGCAGVGVSGEVLDGFHYAAVLGSSHDATALRAGNSDLGAWALVGYKKTMDAFRMALGLSGGIVRGRENSVTNKTDYVGNAYADFGYNAGGMANFGLLLEWFGGIMKKSKEDKKDAKPWGFVAMPSWRFHENFDAVFAYSHVRAGKASFDSGVALSPSTIVRKSPEAYAGSYDRANAFYVGGNWYVNGNDNLKFSLGYEWSRFDLQRGFTPTQLASKQTVQSVRARMQILF